MFTTLEMKPDSSRTSLLQDNTKLIKSDVVDSNKK